jgi:formylglycine-generating enzyme required for sulfatase activity
LTIVAERQFVDWRSFRHVDVNTTAFGQEIGRFCENIAEALHATWISPEERRELDAEDRRRAAHEARARQEAEARRQAEEGERLRKEALAKNRVPLTAEQESALQAGDSFKEGADCPEMIVVPAGRFLMDSPDGGFWSVVTGWLGGQGSDSERPQHEVTITKPFAVAKFALTFDEWDACAVRGGCRRDVSDEGWGRGRRPAINVSWDDAQAYVKWLSSITGKHYRLLSEAEWEYAARAGSQTNYPWGDEIQLNGKPMANCKGCGSQWDGKQTAPAGSFAANAFGLYDMVGNVNAWTEDCWNDNYEGAPTDGSAWTSGDCRWRISRGGCWGHGPDSLRSGLRHHLRSGLPDTPLRQDDSLGFRVARTL